MYAAHYLCRTAKKKRFHVCFVNTNASVVSYPEVLARLVAEATAIRVVGAAEGLFGDGARSRPVVAVQRVPNHQSPNKNITVVFRFDEIG